MNVPIPVFCQNPACRKVWFNDRLLNMSPSSGPARIGKGTISPCPHCGGTGRIPGGMYSTTSASLFKKSDLDYLKSALTDLKTKAERGASSEEISEQIDTNYPALRELKRYLPKNAVELTAYLVALSSLFHHCAERTSDELPPSIRVQVEVQQVLEQVIVGQKTNPPNIQEPSSGPEKEQTGKK